MRMLKSTTKRQPEPKRGIHGARYEETPTKRDHEEGVGVELELVAGLRQDHPENAMCVEVHFQT